MEFFKKPGKNTQYAHFRYRGWDVELYELIGPWHRYKRRPRQGTGRWSVNLISKGDRDLPNDRYGRGYDSLQLAVIDAKMAINTYLQKHPEDTENPLSSSEGIVLGLALVGGIGAAIYYATRPATTT